MNSAQSSGPVPITGPGRRRVASLAVLVFATPLGTLLLLSSVRGFLRSPPPDDVGASRLIVPPKIALGTVIAGQSATTSIAIRNPGAVTCPVDRVEVSCPCVRVEPPSLAIGPQQEKALSVRFDSAAEPDFRGRLSIEIAGMAGEAVAFRTRVELSVASGRGPSP